jgi:hypothetical protein
MAIPRGLLAVAAGIATFSVALVAMMAAGNTVLGAEPEWINRTVVTQLVWLAWNIVSMIGGGWVTASIAPNAPVAHAVAMGAIQACFTGVAMFTVADNVTPWWLWIAGIATSVPAAWFGAHLRARPGVPG